MEKYGLTSWHLCFLANKEIEKNFTCKSFGKVHCPLTIFGQKQNLTKGLDEKISMYKQSKLEKKGQHLENDWNKFSFHNYSKELKS